MESPVFDTVCFIGIGHIGSSLARALRKHGLARRLVAVDTSASWREVALELGIVDSVDSDPAHVVPGADLVVICTPVGAVEPVGFSIAPYLRKGTIVTDVGSVKMAVIRDLGPSIPEGVHFVPGHPIAGTENSGPASGFGRAVPRAAGTS